MAKDPEIIGRLQVAYDQAPFLQTPQTFVVTDKDWEAYEKWLTEAIMEQYRVKGYYRIRHGRAAPVILDECRTKLANGSDGVPAMTYKGVPIIKRSHFGQFQRTRPGQHGVVEL